MEYEIVGTINKQRTISGEVTKKAILNTSIVRRKADYVKISEQVNNPQVTKVHGIQVGTSETIRSLLEEDWFDWLAGLIDGDGQFGPGFNCFELNHGI